MSEQIFYSAETGGFYHSSVHGATIPHDAVVITQAEYDALFSAQADGQRIEPDGTGFPVAVAVTVALSDFRARALRQVDAAAEAARLQFITPGEGQAWTYIRKEQEAEAWQADPSPVPADYPLLSACIPGDGADLAAVVVSVLAARDAWLVAGAAIEGIRRAAKTQVEAAPDAAAIQTILDGLNWPQP